MTVAETDTDPRRQLGSRRSDIPLLLFPLRLETRFGASGTGDDTVEQLWVRVYPDDCMLDTFEPVPSAGELRAATRFWVDWVAAGGVEEQRRGAWTALVAGSGSGRAAWLIQRYAPDPTASFPVKADPADLVLVVAAQQPVPGPDQAAVAAYWTALWRAGGPAAQAYTDLETALGATRAARVRASTVPRNFGTLPAAGRSRADLAVSVAFLDLPDADAVGARPGSWTQPPRVSVLPERLVLLGYRDGRRILERLGNPLPRPLVAGPDPLAPAGDQIRPVAGDLAVGAAMRWMVDFDEAVRVGMGFRVDLPPTDGRDGFDELIVIGVRLGGDAADGAADLAELFTHHQNGTAGFGLLPQGTPTNNTEDGDSGLGRTEAADDTYDLLFGGGGPLVRQDGWLDRPDGQWLAETLGVELATFDRTAHARGRDQAEARALNTALWPATWGYLMESMLAPVFDPPTVELTRWFFTQFVTGRGTVPAVRIGDQPYGILPTTALSRATWFTDDNVFLPPVPGQPDGVRPFLAGLAGVLGTMRADWAPSVAEVAHVGGPGDPHQVLLDVVGLHPASVQFHQRFAESVEQLSNRMNLEGFGGELIAALTAIGYTQGGMSLLGRLGYTGTDVPELLEKFFLAQALPLAGPLIDDRPLSEVEPVRPYTEDGRNYLQWLVDSARTSLEVLRAQAGFVDGPPVALLYLLLRHALELGYWDTSLRLYERAGVLTGEELRIARLDPSFVHVAEDGSGFAAHASSAAQASSAARAAVPSSGKPVRVAQRSESRYEYLYRAEPAVTGTPDLFVADFIPGVLGSVAAAAALDQQLRALDRLVGTPTARLERLLAEHVDLCTYRLDAWRAGLVNYQLAVLREGRGTGGASGPAGPAGGVYLGAFGWLTDVRPREKRLTPVDLPPELDAVFNPPHGPALPPLMRDSTNGGFIHAPSLNQATAAAILRNGYLANATPDATETLTVNLSSARVRAALAVIDGIRAGGKLGALLGYQLERGLHDRHDLAEVDMFILDLRTAFPLVADRMRDTVSVPADTVDLLEARAVVDGYALVNHVKTSGVPGYPFGLPLQPATAAQAAVIDAEVDRIRDLLDAVADLAVSESVFQTVLGNPDRTASTMDAYSRGTTPPEPDVVRTPRGGIGLTHRMGLHFEPGRDPAVSPNAVGVTPRAHVEPAVNAWLSGLLPEPADVFAKATYVDPADGLARTVDVTQAALGLQPLDLLHVAAAPADQAMSSLDDLIVRHVLTAYGPRWDAGITIGYAMPEPGRVSFFEVGALLRPLRGLLLSARPLTATDVSLPNQTSALLAPDVGVDPARLAGPLADLAALVTSTDPGDDLSTLAADLAAWLADPVSHRADVLAAIDGWIARAMALFSAAALFAVPGSGTGFLYDWKRRHTGLLRELVTAVVQRWQSRLAAFDDLLDVRYPLAGTDEERFELLRQAEAQVSTVVIAPLPPDPADFRTVVRALGVDFAGKLAELRAIEESAQTNLSALLQAVADAQPLSGYEALGLSTTAVEDEVLRFAAELATRIGALAATIGQRAAATGDLVTAAAAAPTPAAAAALLGDAAKALLGEDFRIVPEFRLDPAQGGDWFAAWTDRTDLLGYLTGPEPAGLGIDHPVDDWLYGVARVRPAARDWERMVMLTNAFGTGDPQLDPVQLPYRAGDRWLGLAHPPEYPFDGERLLYTAHYAVSFNPTAAQCGLLVDEWTEVIPAPELTTGIAINYDRPSAEPPQVMLLVTSPHMRGAWEWDDVVDAVRETFAEARLRAVEPTQIDRTGYPALLPATLSAVTTHAITIMLNLAVNNAAVTAGARRPAAPTPMEAPDG